MKYVIIIGDNGGRLTYCKAKPFNINMLDLEFIKNYREIDNEKLNSMFNKDVSRNFKNSEIYKVYVHVNNLKYDNVIPIGYSKVFDFNIVNTKQVYIPDPKAIYINYDFVSGKELSYGEGLEATDTFETNCLDFFNTDSLTEWNDVVVINKNNEYISCKDLLEDSTPYTSKEIRMSHNIHKMLVSNSFTWQPCVNVIIEEELKC